MEQIPLDLLINRQLKRVENLLSCNICEQSWNDNNPPLHSVGTDIPEKCEVIVIDSFNRSIKIADKKEYDLKEAHEVYVKMMGDKYAKIQEICGERNFYYSPTIRCTISHGFEPDEETEACYNFTKLILKGNKKPVVLLGKYAYHSIFDFFPTATREIHDNYIYIETFDDMEFAQECLNKKLPL